MGSGSEAGVTVPDKGLVYLSKLLWLAGTTGSIDHRVVLSLHGSAGSAVFHGLVGDRDC